MNKRSERIIEISLGLVTGLIGLFFTFGFVILCIANFQRGKADLSGTIPPLIMFLIGYWFLKISYKLFIKSYYILSISELKVSGWIFILFPIFALIADYHQGRLSDPAQAKLLMRLLPAFAYGYWAIRAAKMRTASNQEDTPDPKAVR